MKSLIPCLAVPAFLRVLLLPVAAQTEPPATALPPVVVTASPLERTLFEQAQPVSILEGEKLTLSLEPTLGETLSRTPGVRSTYFGPAASRPVIRGLDGDRIRILQNGLNTIDASATSVDHAVSFDPAGAERIEVVRGPATLLYGSNAIGGVVNVIDNRVPDQSIDVPLRGSIGGRYSSADEGAGGDILLEGGAGGFAWHLDGSRRDNDDLRIPGFARSERLRRLEPGEPGARGALPNSFMHTSGFSGGTSYIWDQGYFGAAFSGFDAHYGSPAEEEVSIDLHQRRWDFQGAFQQPVNGIKAIKYRLVLSDYEHTEFEGAEAGTVFMNDGFDGRIEVQHARAGPFEGAFGFQAERSDFSALGEEAFLPETLTRSSSGFLFEEATLTDTVKLQGGVRYDRVSADAESDSRFGPARNRSFDNLSGSLGMLYSPGDYWAVALSAAYSQRAPTSQELYARGPHLATGVFEIGDDGLTSEKALGFDLSLRKRTGRLTGSVTGFYTRFHDFIGQFPSGTREDDLPVYTYRSTGAEFAGIEAEAVIHLWEPLHAPASLSGKEAPAGDSPEGCRLDLELKADYVRARDTRTGEPLPRISPFHASVALDCHRGPFGARLEGIYAGDQHRVADNELPTDGYFMLNAALTYTFKTGSTTTDVFIKGVNLTNEEAREHTSFLKDIAPLGGRGLVAGVKFRF